MRMIQFLFVLTLVMVVPALSQLPGEQSIYPFDNGRPDTVFRTGTGGGTSTITLSVDSTNKAEGAASTIVRAVLDSVQPWGTHAEMNYDADSGTVWDWSLSDSLSLWYNVTEAASNPQYMVFRMHIRDKVGDQEEEWVYENPVMLDATTSGWVNLRIPFRAISEGSDAAGAPGDSGFMRPPLDWFAPRNNGKLDYDKISLWRFAFVASGWAPNDGLNLIPADSVTVAFDGFLRFGLKANPVVFFNGKAYNSAMSIPGWGGAWGGSAYAVEENAGRLPKTNAIKWTQGNSTDGWEGFVYDVNPRFNLLGAWDKDSMKITIKADAVGPMRVQFTSSDSGKIGTIITPTADGQWHDYVVALKDFVPQDNTAFFDASQIKNIDVIAEASGVAGRVVYITDWWTGNPEFDVIAPDAPTGVTVTGGAFQNLITWTDTPNETGAKYNVFFNEQPFTTVDDAGVEDIPLYNLPAGTGSQTHLLYAPNTDQTVTYYYGVEAKDAAGNVSPLAVTSTAITTTAKGVPTINKTAPPSFVADGDLSEWAGMTYILVSEDSATAHEVPNFPIDKDTDMSAKVYVAFDADYLYVAYDVTDDIVSQNASNSYEKDAPDLFLGLYDFRGKRHNGYKGGATPDYHFRFNQPIPDKASYGMFDDNGGVSYLRGADSVNYAWVEKTLESGYTVEAKISLDSLAAKHTSKTAARFHPVEGMRLPIDIAINDNDGTTRNGILQYSVISNDNSYQDMWRWTYTWIGNLSKPTTSVERTDDVARSYELSQNYPNPFNPSTEIRYSIEKAGRVSLRVYDLVGREVATLVNTQQEPGSYTVTFNPRDIGGMMASGVYFYRLDAGAYVSIKKMVLLK